jgi:hypothetical protein
MPNATQHKQTSNSFWASLKLFDNYRWATLLALGISLPFLLFLVATGNLFETDWFFDLLTIFNFVNTPVSSSGYMATIVKGFVIKPVPAQNNSTNLITKNNTSVEPTLFNHRGVPASRPLPKNEKRGTLIGAVVGIAASIALIVLHETIPFFKTLSFFADCLFTVSTIGSFAGLGNRLGSCCDKQGSRLPNEKHAMKYAAAAGLIFGVLLVCFKAVAVIAVASATTIATGGAALPLWIAGAVAVASCTSTAASMADYTSKAVNFFSYKPHNSLKSELDTQVENRYHEYRGAAVGVGLGLIIGITIAALLIPHVFIGALAIAAAATAVVACVSVIGSLCSRVGRLIDGFKKCEKEAEKEQAVIDAAENKPTPHIQPEAEAEPQQKPQLETKVKSQSTTSIAERDKQSIHTLKHSPSLSFFNKTTKKDKDITHDYSAFVKTHIASNAAVTAPRLSMTAAAA